ncbi:hypothetical protein E4656_02115 [Natronospirillum operosum]|uniref:Polysaccharide chain length determinant N-terminal domain-containing protein n=1 Tax=Natronospirillum operosum TaxID=2759953 RepID=A0A4Z0WF41_9GAMM|nr:Wzz/FepE/Etk N-terminal domain-containing protein [Natronospirillum operosum]TGG95238.1 hypothetical protein E4656_02115 [Natronospirillum operosum]
MTNQTPKPPEHYPYPHYADDEISLVDLAKILIKRRWWVLGTAALIILAAFGYTRIAPTEPVRHEMVTFYEVAQYQNAGGEYVPLQAISDVLQRLENEHWPLHQQSLRDEGRSRPAGVSFEQPKDSVLIRIESSADHSAQPEVATLHQELLTRLQESQQTALDNRRDLLSTQIERIETSLNEFSTANTSASAELAARYGDRMLDLMQTRDSLQPGRIGQLAVPVGSTGGSGPNTSLILALGIVLGGMLGLMAGFFAEFAGRVRQSIREEGGV